MTLYRLDLYRNSPWEFGRVETLCGCFMFDLGPIGFTWLSDECLPKDA